MDEPHDCTDIGAAYRALLVRSVLAADKHRRISKVWAYAHYVLGLPAAIVTTVVGVAAVQSEALRGPAAYIIIASGALSATITFLRCDNNRDRNNAICAGWTRLADCARIELFDYQRDKKAAGDTPCSDVDQRYRLRWIELNREKMQLLWGTLRAGPQEERLADHVVPRAKSVAADTARVALGRPVAVSDLETRTNGSAH